MDIDDDLIAAGSAPLVLAILTDGDNDGYAIARRVRELSAVEVEWADGMLYPVLHRLCRLGYLTADWRTASEGRRRRYYALTATGRDARAARRTEVAPPAQPSGRGRGRLLVTARARPARARRRTRPAFCPPTGPAAVGHLVGAHR